MPANLPSSYGTQADYFNYITALAEAAVHGDDQVLEDEHVSARKIALRANADIVYCADSGNWSTTANWYDGTTNRLPTATDIVLIGEGVVVTYDRAPGAAQEILHLRLDGTLQFATAQDTELKVDTIFQESTGIWIQGTEASPIGSAYTSEIIFADNGALTVGTGTDDPLFMGRGAIFHGTVTIHGAVKTPWVYLNAHNECLASATSCTLASAPTNWAVGDEILIPGAKAPYDTAQGRSANSNTSEYRTLTSSSGTAIGWSTGLTHSHQMPRSPYKSVICNLTRNVVFRPENAAAATTQRAHVMFMHNLGVAPDVRYAAFNDLGRTSKAGYTLIGNDQPGWYAAVQGYRAYAAILQSGTGNSVIKDFDSPNRTFVGSTIIPEEIALTNTHNLQGRYPLHFHRVGITTADKKDPAVIRGCVVQRTPGWGIVHHDTHMDIIDCIVTKAKGAHIVAETGNETGLWLRNIVADVDNVAWQDSTAKNSDDMSAGDFARHQSGYFFKGRIIRVKDCKAFDCHIGYSYANRGAIVSLAETLSAALQDYQMDQPTALTGYQNAATDHAPIAHFQDCDAVGTAVGFLVVKSNADQESDLRTLIKGLRVLNVDRHAIEPTYTGNYTWRDLELVNDSDSTMFLGYGYSIAILHGTNNQDQVFVNTLIENHYVGVKDDIAFTFVPYALVEADGDGDQFDFAKSIRRVMVDTTWVGVPSGNPKGWPGGAQYSISNLPGWRQNRLDLDSTLDLTQAEGTTPTLTLDWTTSTGANGWERPAEFVATYGYNDPPTFESFKNRLFVGGASSQLTDELGTTPWPRGASIQLNMNSAPSGLQAGRSSIRFDHWNPAGRYAYWKGIWTDNASGKKLLTYDAWHTSSYTGEIYKIVHPIFCGTHAGNPSALGTNLTALKGKNYYINGVGATTPAGVPSHAGVTRTIQKDTPTYIDILADATHGDATDGRMVYGGHTNPIMGQVVYENDFTGVTYVPPKGESGFTDTFKIWIDDNFGNTLEVPISITVSASVTIIANGTLTNTAFDTNAAVDITTFDVGTGIEVTTASVRGGASVGTVALSGTPQVTMTFNPDAAFEGTAVIDYTIEDDSLNTADGVWSVVVAPNTALPTPTRTEFTLFGGVEASIAAGSRARPLHVLRDLYNVASGSAESCRDYQMGEVQSLGPGLELVDLSNDGRVFVTTLGGYTGSTYIVVAVSNGFTSRNVYIGLEVKEAGRLVLA